MADNIPLLDRTLYVCPSPVYGYGLERLIKRMADNAPNSAVLCIEADEHLYRISSENFNELMPTDRLKLINTPEKSALCDFVRQTWGRRRFRRITEVRLTGGWQLFPELYASLTEILQREIALDWSNALVLAKLGRRYIHNALRNLKLLLRYPSLARFSFGEAPALVLGAGPSLDTLLPGLKRYFGDKLDKSKRTFRIICVDTCLKSLKAHNIEPDLAVVLESQHWNLSDFIGLGGWNIQAAVDLSALPASAKLTGLRPNMFFTKWTELRFFDRLDAEGLLPAVFPPLGSVGLSAASIALYITRGPVLIAGMDFSFSMDCSHARSSPGHLTKLRDHNRWTSLFNTAAFSGTIRLEAKNGRQVLSTPVMQNYRDIFEQQFGANIRLFDITGSGLPLGIQNLPKEEYLPLLEKGGKADGQYIENPIQETQNRAVKQKLMNFIQNEKKRLVDLKTILTGKYASLPEKSQTEEVFPLEKFVQLIDECDYLWAHFPDYAETGGQRPSAQDLSNGAPQAISFLKRVRAEIDPILKIYEMLLDKGH